MPRSCKTGWKNLEIACEDSNIWYDKRRAKNLVSTYKVTKLG